MEEDENITKNENSNKIEMVIDCSNVVWAYQTSSVDYAQSNNGEVEVFNRDAVNAQRKIPSTFEGIVKCFEYWKSLGIHNFVGIAPSWWIMHDVAGQNVRMVDNTVEMLLHYRNANQICFVPQGEHDDIFIIETALRNDAFVVSNDKYRDHIMTRNLNSEWLKERRIGFMFINDEFIPNPDMKHAAMNRRYGTSGIHSYANTKISIKTITVPNYSLGLIIGSKGANIKEMEQTTHTKINIPSSGKAESDYGETTITIRGNDDESTLMASELIKMKVDVSSLKMHGQTLTSTTMDIGHELHQMKDYSNSYNNHAHNSHGVHQQKPAVKIARPDIVLFSEPSVQHSSMEFAASPPLAANFISTSIPAPLSSATTTTATSSKQAKPIKMAKADVLPF